jgi:DNA polymerase III epsilon subunit-like protein
VHRLTDSNRSLRAPDCPVESAALAFFDLETTGLYPERGATITEIAILDGGGLRLDWRRETAGEPLAEVLPRLVDHLAAGVLVGHNLSFDLGFIAYEAARVDRRGPDVRYLDTLALARRLDPDRGDHQLETLVDAYDVDPPGPLHTAATDVRATREVFWHLVDAGEIETLGDAGLSRIDWSAV